MFKNYFKTALRNIIKQRINGHINIASLSVATTAVVIIAIWVQNELSFDNYHPGGNRIYLLKNTWQFDKNENWTKESSFYPLAGAIERYIPEAGLVTRMDNTAEGGLVLTVNGNLLSEEGMYVDSNWFKVFNYTFIKGNAASFNSNPHSIILTESKAQKLFGTSDIIGKQIQIDSTPFIVTGVVKDNPLNSSFQYDVILPFYTPDYDLTDWLYLRCKTFVKLHSGADPAIATQKINTLLKNNSRAEGTITTSLLPLESMHFYTGFEKSAFKHASSKKVNIFGLFAILMLMTAAINYVNISVARTGLRLKELSIRKINGATRSNLFVQIMMESVVASVLSQLLTIVLVFLCIPALKTFTGVHFQFSLFNPSIPLILGGTLISVILLTGIYPAVLLSSFKPVSLFRGTGGLGVGNPGFKKALIVGQFAFAVFMIIAAIIVYRQLLFIQKQSSPYDKAQVFTVKIPPSIFKMGDEVARESFLNTVKHALLANSPIETACRTDITSLINENFSTSNGIEWDGKQANTEPSYVSYSADADINKIMHFTVIAGRWFDSSNIADKQNVVLNETAVKQFGIRQPIIGRRFNHGTIIGIVKDFYYKNMHEKTGAVVMRTGKPRVGNIVIQANAGQAKAAVEVAEQVWKKYFPGDFFDYSFLEEEFDKMYKNDQQASSLAMAFSGLSILICCLGLLGITIFMTEHHKKEIAIRKVLGATITGIVIQISKDFIRLVAFAIFIAIPFGWWAMHTWLEDYAYKINIGVDVFFIAGASATLTAMATIGFLVIKSAMANPVDALRRT